MTGLTIGVTSTGELVVIVIVDSFGTIVGAGAFPLSAFACLIFEGIIEDAVFDAEGLCGRSDDATLFLILDFEILGVLIVDEAIGECFAVEPLGTATAQAVEDATVRAFLDIQSRSGILVENGNGILFGDVKDQLEAFIE